MLDAKDKLYEEYTEIVAKCYQLADFEKMFALLADDAKWESTWVLEPRVGKETLIKYYRGKTETLKNSKWKTYHMLVKTTDPFSKPNNLKTKDGSRFILAHPVGKVVDYCLQVSDTGEKSDMIIDLEINDDKKISRIGVFLADMYSYEKYRVINSPYN